VDGPDPIAIIYHIVSDTSIDSDGIERLLDVDDPVERRLALKSHLVTPFHLRRCIADEDPDVREAVALHPELTPELMAEILEGEDPWMAERLLSRPDLTPETLEHAMKRPEFHELVAQHPSLTEQQRVRLIESPEIDTSLKDGLQKSELAKNIGFVTFPKMDKDSLRNRMAFFPKFYNKHKALWPGASSGGKYEFGATISRQYIGDKSLPENQRVLAVLAKKPKAADLKINPEAGVEDEANRTFGPLPEAGPERIKAVHSRWPSAIRDVRYKGVHANESHEVQHGVFARLGQKYGGSFRNKVARHLLDSLPDDSQKHVKSLFANHIQSHYRHEDAPEETIAYLHNYLMDPKERRTVHIRNGILNDINAQRDSMKKVRAAWQAMQRTAANLKLEDVNPTQKNEVGMLVEYAAKLAKSRTTSSDNVADHLGFDHYHRHLMEAASFLSGKPVDPAVFRARLIDCDDPVEAVLTAAGLTPDDRPALEGVMSVKDLSKAQVSLPKTATPLVPSATELAADVQDALNNNRVEPVKLGGKHSKGTLLVHDKDENLWLIKPGAGPNSPASGVKEEGASQSRREAAFSKVASYLGISDVPKADLIAVDGREVACIQMLGMGFTGLSRAAQQDSGVTRRVLKPCFDSGRMFEWSILDGVLGSVDRHGNNLLVNDEGQVALIDHGSSFASWDFNPGNDSNSFVPYYLRAWGPQTGWAKMSKQEQFRSLPLLNERMDDDLKKWVLDIDPQEIESILVQYGIDPAPSLSRLANIQEIAKSSTNLSVAVNRMWVGLQPWFHR
jgi:Phosphatidylinositol 3- and 4-kinase